MANAISTKPVKGTRDFFPADMAVRNWLFDHWRHVAASFGFSEYDSCILEHEELYIRKAGDEITSQLYNFTDKSDRRVSLRPEMTPSLARMVMAGQRPLPLRWFAIPAMLPLRTRAKGPQTRAFPMEYGYCWHRLSIRRSRADVSSVGIFATSWSARWH